MILILPPSETKRDGGEGSRSLDLSSLGFPGLARPRRTALAALRRLARNRAAMRAALGLGPQLEFEVDRNRSIGSSPVMPAVERYSGVLFDALDVGSLMPDAEEFAAETLLVHSALFGLVRAQDSIPAYRLSHDSKLPDLGLKAVWSQPVSRELDSITGVILDMRSEGYVALGPLPARENRAFVRVVAETPNGIRRALGHFNKKGKGEFARAVAQSGIRHPDLPSLIDWAHGEGIRLERGAPGQVELVVEETVTTLSR